MHFLMTMTYFVKVNRLNLTDYTIKKHCECQDDTSFKTTLCKNLFTFCVVNMVKGIQNTKKNNTHC